MLKPFYILCLFGGCLVYAATGFFNVEPDETAVTFAFGEVREGEVGPGIHWNYPQPFGHQVTKKTKTNLIMTLGRNEGDIRVLNYGWLTGGTSLIEITLNLQYSIKNLKDFLLNHDDPSEVMKLIAEKELTSFLVAHQVDDILTTGRQVLRRQLYQKIQDEIDRFKLGILLQDVIIIDLSPPFRGQVAKSFQDVQSARSDKDRMIENAQSESARKLYQANAEADKILKLAQSDSFSKIEKANSGVRRFNSLVEEYSKHEGASQRRLYLEKMSKILGRAQLYIMPSGSGSDSKVSIASGSNR